MNRPSPAGFDPSRDYVLFSYTPTAGDPVNANWTIEASLAPNWDASNVSVQVDAAGDRVILNGLAELCAWNNTSGGLWDDAPNWTRAVVPNINCAVVIGPENGVTVVGPAASTDVHRLTIGAASAGVSTLRLDHGTLQVSETTTIQPRGRLAGTGTLLAGGPVANAGEIDLGSGGLQILGGPITNTGLIHGHGRIESTLSNAAGGEVRADAGKRILWGGADSTNTGTPATASPRLRRRTSLAEPGRRTARCDGLSGSWSGGDC